MEKSLFCGVCTALVTPFYNGYINYPMLEQLLRRQTQNGIDAVVLSGTTGESATLSDAEKTELLIKSRKYIGNNSIMIAGTGSNSTEHAVSLSRAAQAAGADALLVVSPYYNKATSEGLIAHYKAIASCVDIPIILYNVPGRTGVDIPVNVYQKLSEVKNIVGVKEACGSISKITKILATCPDFSVWSGNDDMTVPVISVGGHGVISVLSNIYPKETAVMVNSALSGDFATASVFQQKFHEVNDLLFCEVNPIPVKYFLSQMGYDCGDCRLPLTALSADSKRKILDFLNK